MEIQSSTKEEISFHANEFYKQHRRSPRLKDISNLPFSKLTVVRTFGTWNNMLRYANLPLNRYPPQILRCENCKKMFRKQMKEIRKSLKHFCGNACGAQYYTTGRKHSEATKSKISASLRAHRILT